MFWRSVLAALVLLPLWQYAYLSILEDYTPVRSGVYRQGKGFFARETMWRFAALFFSSLPPFLVFCVLWVSGFFR